MRVDSLRGKSGGPPCPAHDVSHSSHSGLVLHLYSILELRSDVSAIVWDWHCIPGNANMHIDATVILESEVLRFELDSRSHFKGKVRQQEDVEKDRILLENRIMLLRLHEDDKGQWGLYVDEAKELASSGEEGGVYYSGRYEGLLGDRQRSCVLHLG